MPGALLLWTTVTPTDEGLKHSSAKTFPLDLPIKTNSQFPKNTKSAVLVIIVVFLKMALKTVFVYLFYKTLAVG